MLHNATFFRFNFLPMTINKNNSAKTSVLSAVSERTTFFFFRYTEPLNTRNSVSLICKELDFFLFKIKVSKCLIQIPSI